MSKFQNASKLKLEPRQARADCFILVRCCCCWVGQECCTHSLPGSARENICSTRRTEQRLPCLVWVLVTMGNAQAAELCKCGYRVLGVQPNSPASKVGLVSFFDFIVAADGECSCLARAVLQSVRSPSSN